MLCRKGILRQCLDVNKTVAADCGVAWHFTHKQYTAWGGLRVFDEMLRRLRWQETLAKAPLAPRGSNLGIDPALMVQAFLVTVWTGGARFAQTSWVRFDWELRGIFGVNQVASVSTFSRFFRRFGPKENEALFRYFIRLVLETNWPW